MCMESDHLHEAANGFLRQLADALEDMAART
jgi:hypothetical protein